MSRVGKVPVSLTHGAKVEISGLNVKIHGAKGSLEKGRNCCGKTFK
jgi:ribosomal protein L6P/L9E